MQVQSILNAKGTDVTTVKPDSTVRDLVTMLREHGIGAVVVSNDGVSIEGIVSERDIVRQLTDFGPKFLSVKVREIMTKDVMTCSPSDTVDDCMEMMTGKRIRHLPVAVADKLTGLVSIGDIVKAKMEEILVEAESLKQYIASG